MIFFLVQTAWIYANICRVTTVKFQLVNEQTLFKVAAIRYGYAKERHYSNHR